MKTNNATTMKYDYGNRDSEYVFCYKSRPFAVLVSDSLPTPNSSFVDHLLVNELGLKINDIQCKKISFGGKKLRLLGRVNCTVQCVKDGRMFGNFNYKACVIENLNQHFDTHSIAGANMIDLIHGDEIINQNCTSAGSQLSPSPRSTPRRATSRTPPPARPTSPPGFPTTPQYEPPRTKFSAVQMLAGFGDQSPRSHNLEQLDELFGGADTQDDVLGEKTILENLDGDEGWENKESDVFMFQFPSYYDYRTGHGRDRCSHHRCVVNTAKSDLPHNCGWHQHWYFPPDFRSCGKNCRGAFCICLSSYDCDYHEFD